MVCQEYFVAALCACFFGLVFPSTLSYDSPVEVNFQAKNNRAKIIIDLEAYAPQGLKISVSKLDGIDFFAFNGKINLPLRVREQGNLTWEIIPDKDVITKYFPESQLLTGDVINFWIRIQSNGKSMQSDVHSLVIKDLKPAPSTLVADSRPQINSIQEVARISTTRRPPQRIASAASPSLAAAASPVGSVECPCNEETLNDVWTRLNKTKIEMQALEETVTPLKNKLSSLTEALDELVKSVDIGTELLLTGTLPVRSNPVEDVRHLLVEKLKLNDLSSSILQAEYTASGISFEVATSIDKLRILKRAKDLLVKLPYQIVDLKGQPVLDIRSSK